MIEMITEGRGISDIIKDEVSNIWNLFLNKSYSTHNLSIGYDKIGFKDYELKFVERNNYYSNINVDRFRNCIITMGIPPNGKEKRVKEVISHELTHIIGLNKKDYPKYWNIKKSLIEFKPRTKAGELICHCIYKTLDNEINANIAQTYIYLNNFGMLPKSEYIEKLKEYSEWIEYNNIIKIKKDNIKSKVLKSEIEELNIILIKNEVSTIKIFDIDSWFDFWFNIFNKKYNTYIMINEGRGISELNKEETENIFKIIKKNGYSLFNHQILNRNIEIRFMEGNYDSMVRKNNGKYYLILTAPKKYDDLKLKTIITHELNHLIEVSKIEDKKYRYPNYNKIKRSLIEFKPKSNELEFFKHLLYKTLDNEVNANVSQTYTYLRSFDTSDRNFLIKKLEDYDVRKEYEKLLKFNVSKFKFDVKSKKINFDEFNSILNKNEVDTFLDFINEKNIEKYIDSWFKIIKSNIKKLLKKQENIINEVIEDFNNYNNPPYEINEKSILLYYQYLNENIDNE